jgi:hypothetical protein
LSNFETKVFVVVCQETFVNQLLLNRFRLLLRSTLRTTDWKERRQLGLAILAVILGLFLSFALDLFLSFSRDLFLGGGLVADAIRLFRSTAFRFN